ncbi:MAG: HIT domain-containing protein [Rickettsiaceae bacterium]|nr:MAG: HIT domain-containing protein [Rickettsiaceae bacterium]
MYDTNNIFAKIIRGEVAAKIVYEDANVLAIHDINPVAPIHVLIFPKGQYISFEDFTNTATGEEITDYFLKVSHVAKKLGIARDAYRIITNIGLKSGQTIFHFHTHIISGKEMTKLIE